MLQTGVVPLVQFVDRGVDVPAITQVCQCPSINQATKHAEFPQIQYIVKVVDMPVSMQRQVPQIQTPSKTWKSCWRSSSGQLWVSL